MIQSLGRSVDRLTTFTVDKGTPTKTDKAAVPSNWLGHTKGSAAIDRSLVFGATMTQLLKAKRTEEAVLNHIRHLLTGHGLRVLNTGGWYKFDN